MTKLAKSEITAIFGDAIPIEAVNILFDSPDETPITEMRAQLAALAKKIASDAAPDIHTNPICVEYADCIHRIAAAVRRGHMEHAQRMIDELREFEAEHPVEVAAFEAHYNKEGAR